MRNLKKHIIMVSAAAMFAAAGLAGNSVFAAEPTTDNFVLPPQMTEQQKADWAKDNPQYREKETQQAERTARMAPKAVTPDEVTIPYRSPQCRRRPRSKKRRECHDAERRTACTFRQGQWPESQKR